MQLASYGRLCNVTDTPSVYTVGQPLICSVVLLVEGNTFPTFATISCGNTVISNLEMCESQPTVYTIDLAPYIQSFFDDVENLLNVYDYMKTVNVTITNDGEASGSKTIELTLFCMKKSVDIGENPALLNGGAINEQADGMPTGVYTGDVVANDRSVLYFPQGYSSDFLTRLYTVVSSNSYASRLTSTNVTPLMTGIDVKKGNTTMWTRNIIRKPVCDNTIVLKYLNKFGAYEYFFMDNKFTTNYSYNRSSRLGSIFQNYRYGDMGEMTGIEEVKRISASVLINDSEYRQKFLNLLTSRRVYIIIDKNLDWSSQTNWVEVDITSSPSFVSSVSSTRVNVEFEIKNEKLW